MPPYSAGYSFGKYIVTRSLGRGGMAEVYQAHDPVLDRLVAIKVILPQLVSEEGFAERFLREAKLIASLRHAHLVQLIDFEVAGDQTFMVMEYLDGGSLQSRLATLRERKTFMPLGEVARLLNALAAALDYAHARGAIHRDIKPANILFTAQDEPVLADFGIARMLDQGAQISMPGSLIGTPAYMSPEQAAGNAANPCSDLYALGVVVYELTTGRVPFWGDSPTAVLMKHLTEPPLPPRTLNSNLPVAVERVILQALAKEPTDRFANAAEFAQAFDTALRGEVPRVAPVDVAPDDFTVIEQAKSATVSPLRPQPSSPLQLAPSVITTDQSIEMAAPGSIFVARERELAQLQAFLDRTLAGQGQVCFVTGEAGSGKTALVAEFSRRAHMAHADLIIAAGNCNTQSGVGDPYLPFRELLARLIGMAESEWTEKATWQQAVSRPVVFRSRPERALVDHGPDLIDIFIPGHALMAQLGDQSTDHSQWIDQLAKSVQRKAQVAGSETGVEQRHIFEQYANVLKALAAQQPLLLVVDDLQWIDFASIDLLFHLSRRIGESRILLVGTYRPDEVALGRRGEQHPLEKVLAELKRGRGDIQIPLEQEDEEMGRRFVDDLLDAEPNELSADFRQALFLHTGGHALFTVELLRNMQERGDLTLDDNGCWKQGSALNWDELSPRVEGVIEERIGRLAGELREILSIASVQGEDFTAEVVARVQNVEERGLIRRLSRELDRQHRLVGATGQQRVDGQRISRYRFRHHLFQHYLYNRLDLSERAYFHEDVGTVLEELYGEQVDQVAVQLAWHFEEADLPEKARHYLYLAGEQARRRYALSEALSHLSRALDLTPETALAERYTLLISREKTYEVLSDRQAQSQDLAALESLADAAGDHEWQCEVALRRANYAETISDYATAVVKARVAIELAKQIEQPTLEALGHLSWGRALLRQSDYVASRFKLEQGLALAKKTGMRRVEAGSLRALGIVAYSLGDYEAAVAAAQQALDLYETLGDRRGQSTALNNLGNVLADQGKNAESWRCYTQGLQIYREIGDREGEGIVLGNLGLMSDEQGDRSAARSYFEQSLQICREIGARLFEANALAGLGALCLDEHDYSQARVNSELARSIYREIGDRRAEAIAVRNLGNVSQHQGDYTAAQHQFEQALHTYRDIGDRMGEGSALVRLGVLLHDRGESEAARQSLQEGLHVAQDIGDYWQESEALTKLGHTLLDLGQLSEAEESYHNAVKLWQEQGRHDLSLEAQAGLAVIAERKGALIQAKTAVEDVLRYLETNDLVCADDIPVYLMCYRVLKAVQDQRSGQMLDKMFHLLQERASKIEEADIRRAYLENIAAHRDVISAWETIQN